MNEGRYITRIHQKVKRAWPTLYFVKVKMMYVSGIPDCYYSGDTADLWAEYKYRSTTPKREDYQLDHEVTALQEEFLTGRKKQGRQVALIVGCPNGTAIYTEYEWENKRLPTPKTWLNDSEVIEWLAKHTM